MMPWLLALGYPVIIILLGERNIMDVDVEILGSSIGPERRRRLFPVGSVLSLKILNQSGSFLIAATKTLYTI